MGFSPREKPDSQDAAVALFSGYTNLVHGPLAATTADTRAVDAETLLGLVTEAASLVRTSGAADAAHGRQLTVFPHTHALEEAEHIALLLLPQLLDVFVSLSWAGERNTCPSVKYLISSTDDRQMITSSPSSFAVVVASVLAWRLRSLREKKNS